MPEFSLLEKLELLHFLPADLPNSGTYFCIDCSCISGYHLCAKMSSKKDKKKQRKNKCSRCSRLARDHIGPSGPKCDWSPSEDEEDGTSSFSIPVPRDHNDSVLGELANQMGQLSIQLKKMETDIQDVKLDVRSVKRQDAGGSPPRSRTHDYMSAGAANAGTIEAHVCLPSGAKVLPKIITHARPGEYINLADFAPCLEPSLVTETSIVDGELIFKPKRSIDSFL
jgi:hypothetical protein